MEWLAWDEGFRRGQASRAADPSFESETTAWLNHLTGSVWGGHKTASQDTPPDDLSGSDNDDAGAAHHALNGLSSFVSE